MRPRRRPLPATVVWLGVVSLATDASSEMIYPLLPLYLTTVLGAGPSFVGAIEGAAEATASLLKLIAGRLTDRSRRRKPLTVLGYGISSLVRPLVGLAAAAWMVLAIRVIDRVGKGMRSSPRDALLADVTAPAQRGRAFGLHRAMDHAGAAIGPAAAAVLLSLHVPMRLVFLLAAIPAAVAMGALLFGVKEPAHPEPAASVSSSAPPGGASGADPRGDRVELERSDRSRFRRYLVVLTLFGLGNASDAFLLLRAREVGMAAPLIPMLWMLHSGVKAALSTAGGALSDRLGRGRMIVAGWVIYAGCYLGFGAATAVWQVWALFAAYGVYFALVEGTEKALVVDLVPTLRRGRAFGAYHAVVGLTALPASIGFGALVAAYGPRVPFTVAAALAGVAALALQLWVRPSQAGSPSVAQGGR